MIAVAVAIVSTSILAFQSASSASIGTTVTFVANDGQTLLMNSQVAQVSGAVNLELFNTLFPSLNYPNHTFAFWSNQPGGGGTTYADGASYSFSSDITLYAQWVGPSHTVTFAENVSPSDPTETSQVSDTPTPLTLFSNLGVPFQNPNHAFAGWNTMSDGSGQSYLDGALYSFSSAIVLFAQWTPNSETLQFSSNTGAGVVSSLTAPYGSSIALPTGAALSKANYSFTGWNTMPDGSGTEMSPGTTFTMSAGQTLYATWSRKAFVVTFVTPGGHSGNAPISVPAGATVTLQPPASEVPTGYSFGGWFTALNGGQLVGRNGTSYTPAGSTALYAHWLANPKMRLGFSSNGGVGVVKARFALRGLSVVIPGGAGLHRPGFTFLGWSTTSRAVRPDVKVGARFLMTRSRTIYAMWRRDQTPRATRVLLGSVGTFAPNSSALTNPMRRLVATLALGIEKNRRTEVFIYGYTTSKDSSRGAAQLSMRRAVAVEDQLRKDLVVLGDGGVVMRVSGEARLSNSVLASFRNVEVFAN
ncbi:MAG: InlB B-repeat-containing protein [Acidobacteriota bacterium]|nr:InlB B-repeat-containing protein [Acidobacteriota bacterium]